LSVNQDANGGSIVPLLDETDKETSPPSLAFKMQIANFIVEKFPRQESRKELSSENNRKVTEV